MDPVVEKSLRELGLNKITGVDEAGRGCERIDAEVLTKRGWLTYDKLSISDYVLSYTDDNEIKWQKINNVIIKEYDGELVHLSNKSVDIFVTPDHCFTVLVRKSKRYKNEDNKEKVIGYRTKYKNVNDLIENDYIPRGGVWRGKRVEYFILPGLDVKNGYRPTSYQCPIHIPIMYWAAFLGLYVSEGCCTLDDNGNYRICISQTRKSYCFDDIEALLRLLPFHFKYSSGNFVCRSKQLYTYLKGLGDVYTKHLPSDFKNLESSVLNEFLLWAVKGDGTKELREGRQPFYRYYSSSVRLVDDIQEVLLKAGWTYSCVVKTKVGQINVIRGREVATRVDSYCITFRRSLKAAVKHLKKEMISYNGKVFCLSLSAYHNFCVRRNGRSYFTGNSLAGPVVVASVMLPVNHKIDGINDSKKLSRKKREEIADLIFQRAIDVQVSLAMNGVVDRLNIYNATKKCIKETLDNAKVRPDIVIIDGSFNHFKGEYELPFAYQTLPKGDALSENVAAASIIAKTHRDIWMETIDSEHPEYGFAKHKGYGTKQHMEALIKHGPCPLHRMTFSIKGRKIGDL